MKIKSKTLFIISGALFLLFLVFTVLIMTVDVAAIGPEGSEVGLSSINNSFHELTGFKEFWYEMTDLYGYFGIFLALGFCVFGIIQLIMRKSLKKVDKQIILLGALYVITAIVYVLFEIVIINYRPIILDAAEGLEASYPSSHTMLIIVIMGSVAPVLSGYIDNKAAKHVVIGICTAIGVVTVIGRLISGVHWLTDILASIILGFALLTLFYAFLSKISDKTTEIEK